MKTKKIGVIIPAAGQGKRMKADTSKQYIEVEGKPILAYTIEKFQQSSLVDEIVIVVGQNEVEYVEKYIKNRYNFTKIKSIIKGGKERQDSVFEGLKVLSQDIDIVLIHDGVRPLIRIESIDFIIEETIKYKACILGVNVKDTIKVIDEYKNVVNTPDRNQLYAIQTPQAFQKELILLAYKESMKDGFRGTDDSTLVERYTDTKVKIVEGSYMNIKITTPEDFIFFKEYMNCSAKNTTNAKIKGKFLL
ncbi:MAG: 2-C-methyl-D-erythritol 4-phosphate cytidylyltransferase [Firmicutes bacterium HGW-Firmicutes-1]|nr:MAG: 2-C-methyl-D-erythritol 4-phosphate cytidylyltransferase [Firmicutes bacterium HGW-Firmicutes-1]